MGKPSHDALVFAALARRRNTGADERTVRTYVNWEKPGGTAAQDARSLARLSAAGRAVKVGARWFLTPAGYREARGWAETASWEDSDAWVLLALLLASGGQPVELPRILTAADYINHAIPSWEELYGALNRLAAGRLLRARKAGFAPTELAIEMLERVRAVSRNAVLAQLDALRRLMDCPCCGVKLKKVRWPIALSEDEWRAACRAASSVS